MLTSLVGLKKPNRRETVDFLFWEEDPCWIFLPNGNFVGFADFFASSLLVPLIWVCNLQERIEKLFHDRELACQ